MLPLLIAAGASIAGGLMAGKGAQKAAQISADANLAGTRETNALNERLFNQSRGSEGHAILPNYFGDNEAAFGQSAYQNFQRLSGAGNANYSRMLQQQGQLAPYFNQSMQAIGNRFNGQDLAQRLAYLAPVQAARLGQANSMAGGYEEIARANQGAIGSGLQAAIAQMNAQRAGQGYAGSSMFDRNRLGMATIAARQAAAQQMAGARFQGTQLRSGANLANAQETAGYQLGNLDYMGNPAVLNSALGAAGSFYNAPAQALSSSFQNAMSPMSFFRLNPQAFQAQAPAPQGPMLNNAQIFGSALGQAGNTAQNYFLQQQLAQQYGGGNGVGSPMSYGQFTNQYGTPGATPQVSTNWSFEQPQYVQSNWSFGG